MPCSKTSQELLLTAFVYPSIWFLADTMVDALRQLAVPSELCRSFLRLAEANTSRAVETCGILCGKLVRLSSSETAVLLKPVKRIGCE